MERVAVHRAVGYAFCRFGAIAGAASRRWTSPSARPRGAATSRGAAQLDGVRAAARRAEAAAAAEGGVELRPPVRAAHDASKGQRRPQRPQVLQWSMSMRATYRRTGHASLDPSRSAAGAGSSSRCSSCRWMRCRRRRPGGRPCASGRPCRSRAGSDGALPEISQPSPRSFSKRRHRPWACGTCRRWSGSRRATGRRGPGRRRSLRPRAAARSCTGPRRSRRGGRRGSPRRPRGSSPRRSRRPSRRAAGGPPSGTSFQPSNMAQTRGGCGSRPGRGAGLVASRTARRTARASRAGSTPARARRRRPLASPCVAPRGGQLRVPLVVEAVQPGARKSGSLDRYGDRLHLRGNVLRCRVDRRSRRPLAPVAAARWHAIAARRWRGPGRLRYDGARGRHARAHAARLECGRRRRAQALGGRGPPGRSRRHPSGAFWSPPGWLPRCSRRRHRLARRPVA